MARTATEKSLIKSIKSNYKQYAIRLGDIKEEAAKNKIGVDERVDYFNETLRATKILTLSKTTGEYYFNEKKLYKLKEEDLKAIANAQKKIQQSKIYKVGPLEIERQKWNTNRAKAGMEKMTLEQQIKIGKFYESYPTFMSQLRETAGYSSADEFNLLVKYGPEKVIQAASIMEDAINDENFVLYNFDGTIIKDKQAYMQKNAVEIMKKLVRMRYSQNGKYGRIDVFKSVVAIENKHSNTPTKTKGKLGGRK